MNQELKDFFSMLQKSVSPYHAVEEGTIQLKNAGYIEQKLDEKWQLNKGNGYFIRPYGSTLIAFYIGEHYQTGDMLRVEAAHTDWPCLKLKSLPEKKGHYQSLNVEVYGGPILSTWLDRPLSAAGRVALKSSDIFHPKIRLIDFEEPYFTIPNLAIHMNRKINEGVELNRQVDMLPLCGINESSEKTWFASALAEKLQVDLSDIIDYEINIYNKDQPALIGFQKDLISSPRLDNISSVQACLSGLIQGRREHGINLIALFDNEEIGSHTKQGGDSNILPMVLEHLYTALGQNREDYLTAIAGGMMLSVDVAHAIHPNHPEKCDITNQIYPNEGVAIKLSGNQRYATDCEAVSIVEQLCRKHQIPYKKFANRSDIPGGSTLGTITSSFLPMKTVDLGAPILAMHSSRETMGANDQISLCHLTKAFFQE
ncbi:MAG: M18 family aminopeptidase [Lachnospiraceae bacterium]|nr:M18 family aminopeptidase [Lachnospiraceae bacterium]